MRMVDRIRGHSWQIFVEDSQVQIHVYEYFNSPWNSVNLETVVQCTVNKEEIDRQKEDREEREWKAMNRGKDSCGMAWNRSSGRLWKFSSLSIFSCLQHSMKSNDRFCRSSDHWLTWEYCVYEWTMWGIYPRDGLDSTWGARDFCGSSKLDGFRTTSNMRKSLSYAARVARVRIHGIRKDIPRPTKRR